MEGGRYKYYVVRKGTVPEIYTKWVDCERQVLGFKGNEYKGFQVRREAVEWLHFEGDNGRGHDDDHGGGGQPSDYNGGTLPSYFRGLCITSGGKGVSNVRVCSSSPAVVGGSVVPFVQKEEDVVVAEDTEEMLLRACVALSIPPPSYYRRDSYTKEGGNVMGFVVVILDNHLGLELIARGVLFSDEIKARCIFEDAQEDCVTTN